MDMPIRIKRSFFYFKLNVIVKIKLLVKFDYCTIHKLWIEIYEMTQIFKADLIKFCEIFYKNQNCYWWHVQMTIIHQDLWWGKLVPSPYKRSELE